ncbi:hypothetical protein MTO96_043730, partial [Rhipicephalus appendiculatus]
VTYFSKFGRTDIPDTLRRLLRSFMSKEAALQFSWKGSAGNKLAFVDLKNINDLLLGVQHRVLHPQSTGSPGNRDSNRYQPGRP